MLNHESSTADGARDRLFKNDHVRPIDRYIDYFGTEDRSAEPAVAAPGWLARLLDTLDPGDGARR